jgi:hypothetical protein
MKMERRRSTDVVELGLALIEEPSETPESLRQDTRWDGGSFPDLWPSKKRMDLVRASL